MKFALSTPVQILISIASAAFIIYQIYIRTNPLYGFLIFKIDGQKTRSINLYRRRRILRFNTQNYPFLVGIKKFTIRSLTKPNRLPGKHALQISGQLYGDNTSFNLILVEDQLKEIHPDLNLTLIYQLDDLEDE
jgi:hypothetical protein